jgi:lipopolysaccharide transport system permease protein
VSEQGAVREDRAVEAAPAETPAAPTRVIKPRRGWGRIDLGALVQYRDLIWFLMKRDIQLRYRQTALGVAWAVLQPVATMAVFSLFFGRLGKLPSDGVPYPLFVFCGLLPWQLFAYTLTESSGSLVANQNLVTKIYFPRLVIPLSATLAGLMDFLVSMFVLLVLMAWFHVLPSPRLLIIPLLLLLEITLALGVGLWLCALNVRYRDVRYTLPFLTQLWLFATPIAYPATLVPERFRPLLGLNPMSGVVEGFRWALLGTGSGPGLLWVSALMALVVAVTGLQYFARMERTFADRI